VPEKTLPKTQIFLKKNVQRILKDDLKISQNRFSERIEMSPSSLSDALNGVHEPGFAILERIAEGLGLSVAEILADPSKSHPKARVSRHSDFSLEECAKRLYDAHKGIRDPNDPGLKNRYREPISE
jgi:transcriptional regulator with XRE-family HTH domain